jgi:hypothetical protein
MSAGCARRGRAVAFLTISDTIYARARVNGDRMGVDALCGAQTQALADWIGAPTRTFAEFAEKPLRVVAKEPDSQTASL